MIVSKPFNGVAFRVQSSACCEYFTAAKMGKTANRNKVDPTDIEDVERSSFTPGWNKRISQQEGLPIKKGSKVIRVVKDVVEKEESGETDGSDNEEEEYDNDDEQEKQSTPVEPTEFEFVGDVVQDHQEEEIFEKERQKKSSKPEVGMVFKAKTPGAMRKLQVKLAEICSAITTNPERSLKRKPELDDSGDRVFRMTDLFEMLDSSDIQTFEMSMLSALLVFRDICPGYRIRTQEEGDTGTLKKETRALRDFELALLGSYKKYLTILDEKVQLGLGNAKKDLPEWGPLQQLGLSALRCMCELVRTLSHFNFKSLLLAAVVSRAAQSVEEVSTLCCETLTNVLVADHQGETSYEIVCLIAKVLVTNKYNVPTRLLKCLEKVKMTVHADQSKHVHQRAKRERRKRKKSTDEVDVGLLESKATSDDVTRKRFQADALTEVSLIYFRIIKQKIGFSLMPTVLEGLGGITHLINIDTVEDLIQLMRGLLEAVPPTPLEIQLLCIHCALRTLSGPGEELKIDEEFYLVKLRSLLRELPANFERWDIVLECVDLCFIKKREERNPVVMSFIKVLLLVSTHLTLSGAQPVLAMIHTILLRYPRARQSLTAIADLKQVTSSTTGVVEEEDKVVDLAMQALREGVDGAKGGGGGGSGVDGTDDLEGDGSWILSLLRHHMDERYIHITNVLSSRDLLPLPLRISDARYNPTGKISDRLETFFQVLPSTLVGLKRHRENSNRQVTAAAKETDTSEEVQPAKKKSFFKKSKEESNSFKNNKQKKGGGNRATAFEGKPPSAAAKGGFNKNFKKGGGNVGRGGGGSGGQNQNRKFHSKK